MYIGLYVKCRLLLAGFNEHLNFLDKVSKKPPQIPNFMKICPVGAGFFHTDGRTVRQTDMTKLIVAFLNFANAPTNNLRDNYHISFDTDTADNRRFKVIVQIQCTEKYS
jgi:hypothetical protein